MRSGNDFGIGFFSENKQSDKDSSNRELQILSNEAANSFDDRFYILSQHLADADRAIIVSSLNELFSLLPTQSIDEARKRFISTLITVCYKYFNVSDPVQQGIALDSLWKSVFKLYDDLQGNAVNFWHRNKYKREFFQFFDHYVSYYQIMENLILYIMNKFSDDRVKQDMVFILAVENLSCISQYINCDEEYGATIILNMELKIIARILFSISRDVDEIVKVLFSYFTSGKIIRAIVDSISQSIARHEPYTRMLSFTGLELSEAYERKLQEYQTKNLKLEDKIGEGSYGDVYKASSISGEKSYAIKCYREALDLSVNHYLMLFLNHARHPNVVNAEFMLKVAGNIGYAMQYAKGDLHYYVFVHQNLPPLYNSISCQILEGIKYMSAFGYVHNDLKPSNILIFEDDKVKISDYDTVMPIGSERKSRFCTYSYASPEEDNKGALYATSSDIFSFGGVMYYMLVKESPWQEIKNNHIIIDKIAHDENQKICEKISSVDYRRVVSSCWQFKPENRPSAEQLIESINKIPIQKI